MSDLAGSGAARASNGGARTGGPVPVSGSTPIRTPRDVMRERNAREARRQQEQSQQREEEQRMMSEERKSSAERRMAATVPGTAPRFSHTSSQYSPDAQQGAFDGLGDRRNSRLAGEVAGTNVLGEPTARGVVDPTPGRARPPSVSQPEPLRLNKSAPVDASRRTQPSQVGPRPPPAASAIPRSAVPPSPTADAPQARASSSSFPHAFERWETLSSHWEGLTSYWLHKLEQNTDEIRENVPNATTLNRQITDLSAAGANLFHAVVELQRLRASSERKFQRWFFETRADNEKSRELQAGMERQLNLERKTREDAARQQTEAAAAVETAKRELAEMRRELMISKDEARRAWEELGRRNQESLDTAQSLKEGRVTLVSGVQVVPYFGQPSRTGSESLGQRPVTRDGPQGYGNGGAGFAPSLGDDREYYRQAPSPANTDPFTDISRQQRPPDEAEKVASAMHYPPPQRGTPGSQTGTVTPASYHHAPEVEAERFYQHGGPGTSLHSSQESSKSQAPPALATTTMGPPPVPREEGRSQGTRSDISYVDTVSEGGTEYALDASGNVRRDEHGRPIVFRRREPTRSSESEDDFDTAEAMRRDRELAERYGSGTLLPEAPSAPVSSAAAMAGFTPTAAALDANHPDYEGAGYEDYQQQVPYHMQRNQHHHPTRLSDVLEEDEERSSRRTGPD